MVRFIDVYMSKGENLSAYLTFSTMGHFGLRGSRRDSCPQLKLLSTFVQIYPFIPSKGAFASAVDQGGEMWRRDPLKLECPICTNSVGDLWGRSDQSPRSCELPKWLMNIRIRTLRNSRRKSYVGRCGECERKSIFFG